MAKITKDNTPTVIADEVIVTVTLRKKLPASKFEYYPYREVGGGTSSVPTNAEEVIAALDNDPHTDAWSSSWDFIDWDNGQTIDWEIEVIDVVS